MKKYTKEKLYFVTKFKEFATRLCAHVSDNNKEWTVKGFIDIYQNVYTISTDTKIISKILEIHLFPIILKFAEEIGYSIVLADKQNYYPDLTFVNKTNHDIKFAIDIKTTYRKNNGKIGFTLGSHGDYFSKRSSTKNIQFPYNEYIGHFCLGIIYDKSSPAQDSTLSETEIYRISSWENTSTDEAIKDAIKYKREKSLHSITSVIKNFEFFFVEKWKIASDTQGSGNTANIGSITDELALKSEQGVFSRLGEEYFDDYWLNYKKATIIKNGVPVPITNIWDYLIHRNEQHKFKLVGKGAKRRISQKKTKKNNKTSK